MIFYAPNIHVGGGFELLKSLINEAGNNDVVYYILDHRISNIEEVKNIRNVHFVKPNFISRLKAEVFVSRLVTKGERIFCFHGLPPLFFSGKEIIVFLQNRLYINGFSTSGYGIKTALRLTFERFIFLFFNRKVTEYIVQSNSMKLQLESFVSIKPGCKITVKPFFLNNTFVNCHRTIDKEFDFLYVADGSAHKNHLRLFEAWRLLALKGYFPSLIVTLSDVNTLLINVVDELNKQFGCKIVNVGYISKELIDFYYGKSKSLIYPSLVESFGMPLIEANKFGLSILAGELDYVRDVVNPNETFNPESSISIMLSVLRFLGKSDELVKLDSPNNFMRYILSDTLENDCV